MEKIPNLSMTKNYSLTMIQIGKVAELADRSGKSQGEIVRIAIDLLYDKVNSGEIDLANLHNNSSITG